MKRLAIKGARVLDPGTNMDGEFDVYCMGGRIASIKPRGSDVGEGAEGWQDIDATNMLLLPGLIDIHTHLREPGQEYKETIRTGTLAAAAGGFTTIACMANTDPVNDCGAVTRLMLKKAAEQGLVKVRPVGALSPGLEGKQLSEIAELVEAGCVAISDDGQPVISGQLMRMALEYSRIFDIPVITHAEDLLIGARGVMNEGAVATHLGLRGTPNAAEDAMVARDIALAELTKARLHVAHVSTRGAVELIRAAKERGVRVTAEATPHHLTLTDEAVRGYDTNAKMCPPLRTQEDVEALRAALKDGTIDCIATDHAPHSSIEKDVEFDLAANGIVGLETALSLMLELVKNKVMDLSLMVSLMTTGPAGIIKDGGGTLKIGTSADMTIVDLKKKWTVDPSLFRSKGRNTPFTGRKMIGKAVKTIVEGNVVFDIEE